jgi:hypothetical protein
MKTMFVNTLWQLVLYHSSLCRTCIPKVWLLERKHENQLRTLPVGYKLLSTLYVISHASTLTVLKYSKVLIFWMTSENWPDTELQTETVSVKEAISRLLNGKVINTNCTITCVFDDSFWVEYNDMQQQSWKNWTWPILTRWRSHLLDGLRA